jgi:hypothetical protein
MYAPQLGESGALPLGSEDDDGIYPKSLDTAIPDAPPSVKSRVVDGHINLKL